MKWWDHQISLNSFRIIYLFYLRNILPTPKLGEPFLHSRLGPPGFYRLQRHDWRQYSDRQPTSLRAVSPLGGVQYAVARVPLEDILGKDDKTAGSETLSDEGMVIG
jgi:hypothetical protein